MDRLTSPIYSTEFGYGLFWYNFIVSNLHHLSNPGKKWSILDFGCGGGGLLAAFALNGLKAEGVEINTKLIERCQGWQEELPGVAIHVMHYDDFIKNGQKYDLVILRDVVEHLENDEILSTILQRTSAIFIATPNRLSLPLLSRDPHSGKPFVSILSRRQNTILNRLTRRERKWRRKEYAMRANYVNVELYSLFRLRRVLRDEGFNKITNLSTNYYQWRQGRKFLQVLSRMLPTYFFESFVAPEIVIYGQK